jgi:hypothetical protein
VFDGWSQAVVRNVKILQCAADKDSGGMNLLIESVLTIYEQNAQTFPPEKEGALQTGQPGPDDNHIIIIHKFFASQSSHPQQVTPVVGFASSTL